MDGEDAHALGLIALDGLLADCLIPLIEEGEDVGRILADIGSQLVEEGADIGTLLAEPFEGEDIVESLDEIVKGHSCQLLAMIAESFGQARVEIDSREQQPIVFGGLSQHIMVPVLHNGSLRELVVGVGEQAQGLYKQTDGVGGIEAESFVGDNSHLGHLLHEVAGNGWDILIDAHEDSYLLLGNALGTKRGDGFGNLFERGRLVIIGRQQADADQS